MRGRWLILAGIFLAVVNGVGCGGTEHERVDPERMLDQAMARSISSATIELDARLRVRGVPALAEPLRLRLEGPYVPAGAAIPRFDWRLSASALDFPLGGRLVSTGDNVYLSLYGNDYEVGQSAVAAANRRLAQGLRIDPLAWLGPARISGEGSAGGIDCERIAAPLRGNRMARDLAPVADELGPGAPTVSGRALACVGYDDRVLHELELDGRLGLRDATIEFDADVVLSEVGEPQEIEAPPGPFRPIRDLLLSLRDFGVPIPLG